MKNFGDINKNRTFGRWFRFCEGDRKTDKTHIATAKNRAEEKAKIELNVMFL